ncbi:uncharacterized protein [Drosophila tropicalis]|uniref:uncharacterized protein n=1 Tax=Drosophila tropicalis TaxID=46794 RepID=UPI0035AC210D
MVLAAEIQNTNSSSAKNLKKVNNFIECQMGDSGKRVMLRLPSIRREVGRPKVFENRKLIEQMLVEHPHFTSIDVQRELKSLHGISVSRRTLQRRISEIRAKRRKTTQGRKQPNPQQRQQQQQQHQEDEFLDENDENFDNFFDIDENEDYRQFEISYLSAEAKKKRLDWALAHQDWTVHDWRNIFNMDDIKFIDCESPCKEIYVDTLLGPESAGNSNDLNLLEQLMAIIQPKIQELPQPPKNVEEFRKVLYNVWHTDQEMVDKIEQLYESMSWRVASVIQSGGDESDF